MVLVQIQIALALRSIVGFCWDGLIMIHDEIEYHLASVTKMVWSIQNCWVKTIQESFGFHLKSRSTRKKLALMYQKSLQKGRTSLSTGRGWLLATPPPSCVSAARLTVRGPSSVRFSGTMNATRQVWRRFVGSVRGRFSFGSNKWAGKASRVTCTLWSCTKKLLFARIRFSVLDGSFLGGYVLELIADVFVDLVADV